MATAPKLKEPPVAGQERGRVAILARDVEPGTRRMDGKPGARNVGRRESAVASGTPWHRASAAVTVEQNPAPAQGRHGASEARSESAPRPDRGLLPEATREWETELIAVVDDGNTARGELKSRQKLGLFGVPSQALDQASDGRDCRTPRLAAAALGNAPRTRVSDRENSRRKTGWSGTWTERRGAARRAAPRSSSRSVGMSPKTSPTRKARRLGELVDDASQFTGKRERVRMVQRVSGPLKEAIGVVGGRCGSAGEGIVGK